MAWDGKLLYANYLTGCIKYVIAVLFPVILNVSTMPMQWLVILEIEFAAEIYSILCNGERET
ncbi:hypothetical protein ACSBR2_004542 [Camellia fascicularis]